MVFNNYLVEVFQAVKSVYFEKSIFNRKAFHFHVSSPIISCWYPYQKVELRTILQENQRFFFENILLSGNVDFTCIYADRQIDYFLDLATVNLSAMKTLHPKKLQFQKLF